MGPLVAARTELERARKSLEALEKSNDLSQLDEHWKNLLRYLERSYFKACAQLKKSSKFQGWTERGRLDSMRGGKDSLLAYLRNARGAEEHGIDPIAAQSRGGIGIGPLVPGGAMFIDEMKVDAGQISIRSRQPLRIRIDPARYTLLDVVNHGVRYPVPTAHLDSPIENANPATIGRVGIAFYAKFLDDAEREFARGGTQANP